MSPVTGHWGAVCAMNDGLKHAVAAAFAGLLTLAGASIGRADQPSAPTPAAWAAPPAATGDIPANFVQSTEAGDCVRRNVMIPMLDGAKLHAVIIIPKGAVHAPIILDPTP